MKLSGCQVLVFVQVASGMMRTGFDSWICFIHEDSKLQGASVRGLMKGRDVITCLKRA